MELIKDIDLKVLHTFMLLLILDVFAVTYIMVHMKEQIY